MNVDSILISEYAKVDEQGRLSVFNAFNKLYGPGPQWGLPVMAVSLLIHGSRQEAATSHKVELRLIDAKRSMVLPPLQFEFTFPADDGTLEEGLPLRLPHTFMLIGAGFTQSGPYAFEVYIDGIWHAAASLVIQRTEP